MRLPFQVIYGEHRTARFANYYDAMVAAEALSRVTHGYAEVALRYGKGAGLVGQYHNGYTTAEFVQHHLTRHTGEE